MPISRRSFLAGSAAVVSAPSVIAQAQTPDLDVIIVGAGAAGIAAARRCVAANRRFVWLEASDRIGGRCITDTRTFGVPVDRGAHWIYTPDINPVAQAATRAGIDIYGAPPGQRVRVGRRYARESEMEDFLSTLVRARRAIEEAARRGDGSCAQALPKDLGDWQKTIEFVLGPSAYGKDLTEMSSVDFSRAAERDSAAFCRIGFGALLARLAERIPVQISSPVARINWGTRGAVEVETASGKRFVAKTAIITVSTAVLASDQIKFQPDLPRRQIDAAKRLSLGSYDHIVLELAGNPLGLQRDDLVFEKSDGTHAASLLANMAGSTLCMVDVAGKFGRELSARGEQAMVAFATEWLTAMYGNDIKDAIRRTSATQWNVAPFVMGASSVAAPGAQSSRRILAEPQGGRMWIVGESTHETAWGTVHGAWDSGERAANDALRSIGALREPEKDKPAPPQRQQRPRQQQRRPRQSAFPPN